MLNYFKRLVKLEQRVDNIMRFGLIKEVNKESNKVVVDFGGTLESKELPYFVPSTGSATLYIVPKVGDQIFVLAKNGNNQEAIAMPSVYKQGFSNSNDFALTFEKGAIEYKDGELKIKADTKVIVESEEVELAGIDGGGVVCKNSLCAFTGAFHPDASTKVKAGL